MTNRIVFMGSPEFSLPILKEMNLRFQVTGVVTQPDRPAGRGKQLSAPPVKRMALELNLPFIQPKRLRDEGVLDQLKRWAPDIIVVAAFGQILRQDVLDLPPLGCINVHASLLPRWRGAAPIQATIFHGDSVTGVTIMKMDAGIDTGPLLKSTQINLMGDETSQILSDRLSNAGADLLVNTLPGYVVGDIVPQPQEEELATYAPQIKKEEGLLDFSRSAVELERQIRAFNPWPGSFFDKGPIRLKVISATVDPENRSSIGSPFIKDGYPAINTKNGSLVLTQLQPAGKRVMSGREFLRGFPTWSE